MEIKKTDLWQKVKYEVLAARRAWSISKAFVMVSALLPVSSFYFDPRTSCRTRFSSDLPSPAWPSLVSFLFQQLVCNLSDWLLCIDAPALVFSACLYAPNVTRPRDLPVCLRISFCLSLLDSGSLDLNEDEVLGRDFLTCPCSGHSTPVDSAQHFPPFLVIYLRIPKGPC